MIDVLELLLHLEKHLVSPRGWDDANGCLPPNRLQRRQGQGVRRRGIELPGLQYRSTRLRPRFDIPLGYQTIRYLNPVF